MTTHGHATKSTPILYYRDPLAVVQAMLQNPLVRDHIAFHPFKVYKDDERQNREYNCWLSGDSAWNMQVRSSCSSFPLFISHATERITRGCDPLRHWPCFR